MFHNVRSIAAIAFLATAITFVGCSKKTEDEGSGKTDKPAAAKVEIPDDYSMANEWTGTYKDAQVTLNFKEDMTGTLAIEGLEEVIPIKYETEKRSGTQINAKVYAMKSSAFAKGSLRMYNSGRGVVLKMQYKGNDTFKVYNGLYLEDGKIVHDDGPFTLKAK